MNLTKRAPLVHKAAHVLMSLLLIFSTTLAVEPVGLVAETNFSPVIPGCEGITIPPPRSSFTIQPGPVSQMGFAIAKDVGKVVAAGQGRSNGSLVVFEERHDSRVGQMEIALMLLRLQRQYGLQLVSLEGAIASKGNLPVAWFKNPADNNETKRTRQAVALRMLRDGEIGAAEFIALVRPQVQVSGNEIQSEYDVSPPEDGNPAGSLLGGIALQYLTPAQIQKFGELMDAEKIEEARSIIVNSDPWVKERFQKLSGESDRSTEELMPVLEEIRAKSAALNIKSDNALETQLNQLVHFYCVASKRSKTIVDLTQKMIAQTKATSVALNIGAGHTPKVVELLKTAGVSYVVISPLALATKARAGDLPEDAYKRKQKRGSVDDAGLLGAILDGRKKLPPSVAEQSYQSKSEIFLASSLLAQAAARDNLHSLDDLKAQLGHLSSIKVDFDSIKLIDKEDQKRVLFKVTARTDANDATKTVTLWAGAWRQELRGNQKEPQDGENLDLEKMAFDSIAVDRLKPPPPRVTRVTRDPHDKTPVIPVVRPKPIPVQITDDVKAVFSTELSAVQEIAI
jgi:hypothetical protein